MASTVFIFIARDSKSVFLPPYDSLKLKHDKKFLMTSVDQVEDPLMSVQIYLKSKG